LLLVYGSFFLFLNFFPNSFTFDRYYSIQRIFRYMTPLSFPMTLHVAKMLCDVLRLRRTLPVWNGAAVPYALFALLIVLNLLQANAATQPGREYRHAFEAMLSDVRAERPVKLLAESWMGFFLRSLYLSDLAGQIPMLSSGVNSAKEYEAWLEAQQASLPVGSMLVTGLGGYVYYGTHFDGFKLNLFSPAARQLETRAGVRSPRASARAGKRLSLATVGADSGTRREAVAYDPYLGSMMSALALTSHHARQRAWVMSCLAAAVVCLGCPSSTPSGPPSACRPGGSTGSAQAFSSKLVSESSPVSAVPVSIAADRYPVPTGRSLRFERNDGQADSRVRFLSRGRNYTLFLTADEAVFAIADAAPVPQADQSRAHVLRIQFVDGSSAAGVRGLDPLPGTSHYLVGADPSKWQTDVPNFGRVLIEDLYPGVNVVYYGHDDRLEYDLILAAGADPARIGFHFGGARSLRLDGDGTLVADAGEGRVRLEKPVIYQEEPGGRRLVAGGYVLRGNGEAGVEVGPYDPSRSLVIDPVIAYSTFLGGDEADQGESIVFDASGHAYITGTSSSATFPTTPDACQRKKSGGGDVFITKLAADGSTVLYSTFLGGGSHDQGWAIAVDRDGEALITGTTASDDFPMTNAFQPAFGGGAGDVFVAKLNARGAGLVFSTYLGGSALDEGRGIAVDAKGDVYVTGTTGSADFRSLSAFQPAFGGGTDAFVV
ncbi:MAG TPA: SBBP repeat-containing protein, partial [Nitrospiraceae bacterium]|nr:SBBP repeat-containing protein [Nitrospiraceae bacterium]